MITHTCDCGQTLRIPMPSSVLCACGSTYTIEVIGSPPTERWHLIRVRP